MNKAILTRLNTANRDKIPVVLITFLSSGEQALYYADGPVFGCEIPEDYLAAAKQALLTDQCQTIEDKSGKVFLQPFNLPLRLLIVGAVHIAKPLTVLANECGYRVTIIDPREAFAAQSRFPDIELVTEWPDKALEKLQPDPRTAIVVLSHDPKLDDPALATALNSPAFYIGALGSRKTHSGRQQRLTGRGFSDVQQTRIHGPIGLDIGAKSPAEIAVSIMAQITACLHGCGT